MRDEYIYKMLNGIVWIADAAFTLIVVFTVGIHVILLYLAFAFFIVGNYTAFSAYYTMLKERREAEQAGPHDNALTDTQEDPVDTHEEEK